MKHVLVLGLFLSFGGSLTAIADDCTAPDSVKKVAKLLEDTFKGTVIVCDDESKFDTKFKFECKGSEYFTIKDPDQMTQLADGRKVYVVSKFAEKDGLVAMTELTYPDYAAYTRGDEPSAVTPTNFLSLSERSFSFYSKDVPGKDSWISATWFIAKDEVKARGYKLYTHKMVRCEEK